MADYPPQDDMLDLADLEPVMINRIYKRLLAEIEAEDAANEAEANDADSEERTSLPKR